VIRTVLLIGAYVAAALAYVAAVDANPNNVAALFWVTIAVALIVGWGTGEAGWRGTWLWLALPWVIVPLALPFGDVSRTFTGGDDIYPVWFFAAPVSIFAMVAMLLGAGGRILYGRRRHHSATR
jgi:hypothetical protein